jgi:hypothetical protein
MSSANKYGSLGAQPYEENIYNSGLGLRMGQNSGLAMANYNSAS